MQIMSNEDSFGQFENSAAEYSVTAVDTPLLEDPSTAEVMQLVAGFLSELTSTYFEKLKEARTNIIAGEDQYQAIIKALSDHQLAVQEKIDFFQSAVVKHLSPQGQATALQLLRAARTQAVRDWNYLNSTRVWNEAHLQNYLDLHKVEYQAFVGRTSFLRRVGNHLGWIGDAALFASAVNSGDDAEIGRSAAGAIIGAAAGWGAVLILGAPVAIPGAIIIGVIAAVASLVPDFTKDWEGWKEFGSWIEDKLGMMGIGRAGEEVVISPSQWNTMIGDVGNDVFNGDERRNIIFGYEGDDTLTGNILGDVIGGGSGEDTLLGNGGDDVLEGGLGNDILEGGVGNDSMEGGLGYDHYRFTSADFADGATEDTIVDEGGRGEILFNGQAIGGSNAFRRTNENTWETTDEQFQLTLVQTGSDYTLVIRHHDTGARIVLQHWNNTDLGISLNLDSPVTPSNPFTLDASANQFGYDGDNNPDTPESGDDAVAGLGGNDGIDGGYGDDWIDGGEGVDFILGGSGNDTLIGGAGDDHILDASLVMNWMRSDTLYGEALEDWNEYITAGDVIAVGNGWFVSRAEGRYIYSAVHWEQEGGNVSSEGSYRFLDPDAAPSGDDTISGGAGNDHIVAGEGRDNIDGGTDNDEIFAGADDDIATGGDGDDLIFGDYLVGEFGAVSSAANLAGNDILSGGVGNDTIAGNGGNDRIDGGEGNDMLFGEDDSEPLLMANVSAALQLTGVDNIDGGAGDDYIDGGGSGDTLIGGVGNDTILGDTQGAERSYDGNDTIRAGEGDDTVAGMGGDDTIFGEDGHDILHGDDVNIPEEFHGNDTINGGDGNDIILGNGGDDLLTGAQGNDELQGGTGNDNLFAGDGVDRLFGGDGNDLLDAGVGNDELSGNEGDDTLVAGDGDDRAVGGMGNDAIYCGYGDDIAQGDDGDDYLAGGAGVDRLSGNVGSDELHGDDGNDFVWGHAGNDRIFGGAGDDYVDGGDGPVVDGSGNDEVHGGQGDDSVWGADGDDQLFGDEGNDSLVGGTGNDSMDGGAGNDVYHFSSGFGSDTIVNLGAADAGYDAIRFDASIDPATLVYSIGDNNSLIIQVRETSDQIILEGFFAGSANHRIVFENGTVLNQSEVISLTQAPDPNPSGRTIHGTPGIDRLVGGDGNDTIYGDLGNDTIVGYGGDDVIYGGPESDTETTIADNDNIFGSDGNDTIYGLQGDDRIDGGNGDDELIGGRGEDVLVGGSGNDTISAGVLISIGGILLDEMSNDLLDGGAGDDILRGGLGSNTYRFDQGFGNDTIYLTNGPVNSGGNVYENALLYFADGISASQIAISRNADDLVITNGSNSITVSAYYNGVATIDIAFANGSTLSPVQSALLVISSSNSGGEYIRGTVGRDTLQGGAGHDEIVGLAGDDTISGGEGNDRLYGDSGNDVLGGGAGNDHLEGGAGSDYYSFNLGDGQDVVSNLNRAAGDYDVVRLGADITRANLIINQAGQDLILAIDGSSDTLTIQGYFSTNSAAQRIRFADGSSLAESELWNGANTISGGDYDDVLSGFGGNDTLYGNNGNDLLDGGIGNDRLIAGFGEDTVIGGDGNDSINGDYYVPGWVSWLSEYGEADSLSGGAGDDSISGQGGDDFIDGGSGTDYLDGDRGNDRIVGGADNDVVNGGIGSDTYVFGRGAGNDRLMERGINGYFYVDVSVDDIDTIEMDSSVTPADVYLVRDNDSNGTVTLRIRGTDDSFTILRFFNYAGNQVQTGAIDRVVFADGTVWDRQEIIRQLMSGSEENDYITPITSVDGSPQVIPEAINAGAGDDRVTGTTGSEFINGGSGNDLLGGGDGNDIIDGGSGNDYLNGGSGSDIFRFGFGSGVDILAAESGYFLPSNGLPEVDVIELGAAVGPENLTLIRAGLNLVIDLGNNTDRLFVENFFSSQNEADGSYPVSEIRFSNGLVWDLATIIANTNQVDDSMTIDSNYYWNTGNVSNARYLVSGFGSSILEGRQEQGSDFNAGSGNDLMLGGYADDRYVVGRNFDHDVIVDRGGTDSIDFIDGIDPSEVSIGRAGNDLLLYIGNFSNYLTVRNYFGSNASGIESISFSNGVQWDMSYLQTHATVLDINLNGSAADDSLTGGYGNDTLQGNDGNDLLAGGQGDDLLDGGAGEDVMRGGSGSDTYVVDNENDLVYEDVTTPGMLPEPDVILDQMQNVIDTVRSSVTYTLPVEVENLELTGTAPINGTGNDVANTITGNNGINVLIGNNGHDRLFGQAGSDSLEGGNGNDYLDGGADADEMTGGSGNDTYIVDHVNDVVIEHDPYDGGGEYGEVLKDHEFDDGGDGGEGGLDTVIASIDYQLGESVEHLTLTGNVAITGTGNDRNNNIVGNANDNVLAGNEGDDSLEGGLGNDTMTGGLDDDALTGGEGSDLYLFARGDGYDVINDESSSGSTDSDTLDFGNAILASDVTLERIDDDLIITVNADGGTVSISNYFLVSDGERLDAIENIRFADGTVWTLEDVQSQLSTVIHGTEANNTISGTAGSDSIYGLGGADILRGLDGNDLIDGGIGNDRLEGGNGNDSLVGGEGSDNLNGGLGIDSMAGGSGNDIYTVDDVEDEVLEELDEGTDTVYSSVSHTLADNIENLTLTGTDSLDATGNALANRITGNAGINILDGAGGNDILIGGTSDDTLIGGEGNDNLNGGVGADNLLGGVGNDVYTIDDIADVVTEGLDEGVDTVNSSISYTLAENVENLTLTGIEALGGTGNMLNNRITGNAGSNVLDGAGGNDILIGGDSNDTLIGGEGNDSLSGGLAADIMIGGIGNDTYTIDNLADVVTELAAEGTDTIRTSITYSLGDNIENLILTGTEAISGTGNALNNRLTGNAGDNTLIGAEGNDVLNGGSGADAMVGGLGNDSYTVDNLADAITELAGEGADTVSSSVAYTLGENLENLTLTGTSIIDGTGNALDNRLTGNAADNVLTAGDGNDILSGAAGNDTLLGGLGNDALNGGVGDDQMAGGAGNDTYTVDSIGDVITELADEGVDQVNASVSYVSTDNIDNITLTGTANINATGNALVNRVTGNAGDNRLDGGDGNDTLSGAAGNDELIGGAGDDVLSGGTGSNVLLGGAGNDRLYSDAANSAASVYEGGIGNDIVTGGQQNDTYRFNIGDGNDIITDKGLAGFTDIISFGADITSSMLQFTRVGNNLLIAINGNTDTITVNGWYASAANQIEQFNFADGSSLNAADLQTLTSGVALQSINTASVSSTVSLSDDNETGATPAETNISTATPEESLMTRLLNEHRFSNQSLLDQIQTLNNLVNQGSSGNGGSAHGPEVASISTGNHLHTAAMLESRLALRLERQAANNFGGHRQRFQHQELGLLIESMSQFGSQNTAVDSSLKPINNDHLQPIVIVAPGI